MKLTYTRKGDYLYPDLILGRNQSSPSENTACCGAVFLRSIARASFGDCFSRDGSTLIWRKSTAVPMSASSGSPRSCCNLILRQTRQRIPSDGSRIGTACALWRRNPCCRSWSTPDESPYSSRTVLIAPSGCSSLGLGSQLALSPLVSFCYIVIAL